MKEQDRVIEADEIELDPKYEPIRPWAQSYFKPFRSKIALPLIHDGKLIGIVNIGEKIILNLSPTWISIFFQTSVRKRPSP